MRSDEPVRCGVCAHFCNDRATLERLMPGLGVLSSMDASVRADDGLCRRHDRYVSPRGGCREFQACDR